MFVGRFFVFALATISIQCLAPSLGQAEPPRYAGTNAQTGNASVALNECDRLATRWTHPDAVTNGVGYFNINVERAISACERAVKDHPDTRRFFYFLGRAFDRAEQTKKAVTAYRRAAELNDPFAMLALARISLRGDIVPPNHKNALRWVRKATQSNHPKAIFALRNYYANGIGVEFDAKRALELTKRAAAAGWVPALNVLAMHYRKGIGTARDPELAKLYSTKTVVASVQPATRGEPAAMARLGWAYFYGRGVQRNYATALKWFQKSIDAGGSGGLYGLAWLYRTGLGVTKDLSRSCDFYEMHLNHRGSTALNWLASCYERGWGRKRDYKKARNLYERATAIGSKYAPKNLARLYAHGRGVKQNLKHAASLYLLSAQRGSEHAMVSYGWALDRGEGVKKNGRNACDWYERAGQLYAPYGLNNLGACFLNGRGRPKNFSKAFNLFERAAAAGNALAMRNLAEIYEQGKHLPKDLYRANRLYEYAAKSGDQTSMIRLGYNLSEGLGAKRDPKTACDWFEKAVKKKSLAGANNLGLCYRDGEGREKDLKRAIELFEQATKWGSRLGMRHLADFLISGSDEAVPDPKRGYALYKQAAALGDPVSEFRHAQNLYWGITTRQNRTDACRWFDKTAHHSDTHGASMVMLGLCWERGYGRKRSRRRAFKAWQQSADEGNLAGMSNLARAYDDGIGTRRSSRNAALWLRKSLAGGNGSLAEALISSPDSWRRNTRRELQELLRKEGLYSGSTNGHFNSAFDQAIWDRALASDASSHHLKQEIVRIPIKGSPKGIVVRLCLRPLVEKSRYRLVVINHGLTTKRSVRRDMRPLACGKVADYFAKRGYLVAFPLRRGYGETGGRFLEGSIGECSRRSLVNAGRQTAIDIVTVIRRLVQRVDVAESGIIVLGHSGGG
jgi:TPR repeat protein